MFFAFLLWSSLWFPLSLSQQAPATSSFPLLTCLCEEELDKILPSDLYATIPVWYLCKAAFFKGSLEKVGEMQLSLTVESMTGHYQRKCGLWDKEGRKKTNIQPKRPLLVAWNYISMKEGKAAKHADAHSSSHNGFYPEVEEPTNISFVLLPSQHSTLMTLTLISAAPINIRIETCSVKRKECRSESV